MVRNSVKRIAASLVVCGALATPGVGFAQSHARDWAPGQRSAVAQRRQVAQRSSVRYVERERERERERSKTKTALMIAGSAATGAGVGGALKGTKGALIGAAIGGGAASIYEAARRR
jgi:hypothetical protein